MADPTGVPLERVLSAVREQCPPRYALDGDKTGLQVGRTDRRIDRVLTTLDLTLEVAEEARDLGAGLIVSHHAVIFRSLRHLRTDDFKVKILEVLLKHEIAVYVPHTAMDVVAGGMNDALAAAVGLLETRFLEETGRDAGVLVTLQAPAGTADAIASLCQERGESLDREGDRIAATLDAKRARSLAQAIEKRWGVEPHVLRLESHAPRRGIGRVGKLSSPTSLLDLATRLKTELEAPGVRLVALDPGAKVKKVAVLCGDGRSFLNAACFAGAQAFVTGDVDHHTALEARARGLALIDVGHWASERHVSTLLCEGLRERLADEPIEIVQSTVDTQPFRFL
ncbi:MAG: Nif3-like dinuclear metal center hexameric protein [Planctomycetes bacterium]|nr:Nif3-like dinuclear metal center hexameric protein [Planctomycetota bacterium]